MASDTNASKEGDATVLQTANAHLTMSHKYFTGHRPKDFLSSRRDDLESTIHAGNPRAYPGRLDANPGWSRRKLSVQVCEGLGWRRPNGKLKYQSRAISGLVGMMKRDGKI